ncbi:MAG: hemerythrin domain-containing protein [Myxococcales bacterium]
MGTDANQATLTRRRELLQGAAASAGLVLAGCAPKGTSHAASAPTGHDDGDEAEVTPAEDLMQEHGVLERVLLIYDESARRLEQGEPLDPAVLVSTAGIVRRFVEDYHEKLEEQFVFPRLQKAQRETDLVAILLQQHRRGREVTDEILRRAPSSVTPELAPVLRAFARMYRPHMAREDTVAFRAFRDLLGRAEYHELGEQFEDKEHALFGEDGFEQTLGEIATLESALGIHDLARFTP